MSVFDEEAVSQPNIKSGPRTMISGCLVALAGIIVPVVLFRFASLRIISFDYLMFFVFLTPLMVIGGIRSFIGGLRQTWKAKREPGEDSDQSPDRNL